MSLKKILLCNLFLFLLSLGVAAEIKMPVIFQSNMVLQRDKTLTIWGFGNAGEMVEVAFGNRKYHTVTGKNKQWKLQLPPHAAGGPYEISIQGKTNTLLLKNILFGDIWICGGQSNMQFSLDQAGYKPSASAKASNKNLRLFTCSVDMDYVPKDDLSGGMWKEATAENLIHFSAVAFFFGQFLQDSLHIPIGLVSDNLGATSIETWMSPGALKQFPQFEPYYGTYLAPGKSFKEITAAFEKMKPLWNKEHYLKGQGFDQKWYLPQTDTRDWKAVDVPGWWEEKGEHDFDGAIWYRKQFDLPENFNSDTFYLPLNQIDDYDIVWVNGTKIGEGYGNLNWRNYKVPSGILKPTGNMLVVRVFDIGGRGGMYSHEIWGNPILVGAWKYKRDLKIDVHGFPKPLVVNVSPFSSPAVLYNGNIAPLKALGIKGIIWYQGEANAGRAVEYKELFAAMIKDWRATFKQDDLPFLFVQLANYMRETNDPVQSDWAELRESQAAALSLPNTGMAVSIDIGEADDIHPKNKSEVGRRLGLTALKVAYHKTITGSGPSFQSMSIANDSIILHYQSGGGGLVTKNKYGYINGFQVAGADQKYYWAKAHLNKNSVVVYNSKVKNPVAVRYLWADNPGEIDLYNSAGLPAIPFRTDDWPLKTKGKLFSENPWEF
ncbi:MAG: sialate O-acetylesterase [Ferruginibacter sp.]